MNPNDAFIKLQIAVRDGQVRLADGLPLPTLGTSVGGELRVPASAFDDPALSRLLSEKHDVELLSEGMEVLIGISAKDIPSHLAPFAGYLAPQQVDNPAATDLRWVKVMLQEPVSWPVTGVSRPLLSKAKCRIPALNAEATSLNHAFTTISRSFEPGRLANTGDAFERVYYQDGEDHWSPLDRRRQQSQRTVELRIRFPSLLKAFGLRDWTPEFASPQLKLFPQDEDCREEAAKALGPYADLLAVAHEIHRSKLVDVTDRETHDDAGELWAAIRHQCAFAIRLDLKQLFGHGYHLIFSDMLSLTEQALAQFDLFTTPACRALLRYTAELLSFVWNHRSGLDEGAQNVQERALIFPQGCDLCGVELLNEPFYVDGSVSGTGGWANMCPVCYARSGQGIGWGVGQLFVRTPDGRWLLVAGFRPRDSEQERNDAQ